MRSCNSSDVKLIARKMNTKRLDHIKRWKWMVKIGTNLNEVSTNECGAIQRRNNNETPLAMLKETPFFFYCIVSSHSILSSKKIISIWCSCHICTIWIIQIRKNNETLISIANVEITYMDDLSVSLKWTKHEKNVCGKYIKIIYDAFSHSYCEKKKKHRNMNEKQKKKKDSDSDLSYSLV